MCDVDDLDLDKNTTRVTRSRVKGVSRSTNQVRLNHLVASLADPNFLCNLNERDTNILVHFQWSESK